MGYFFLFFIWSLYIYRYPILLFVYVFYFCYLFKKKRKKLLALQALCFVLANILLEIKVVYPSNQIYQTMVVFKSGENYILGHTFGRNYYIYIPNNVYEIGDILQVNGDIYPFEETALEGEFSFKEYLFNLNVERKIEIKDIHNIFLFPIRKKQIVTNLLSLYDENSQLLLRKMLFHQNEEALNDRLYALNIGHLFSFSSLYFYTLFKYLNLIFKNLLSRKSKKYSELISWIFILPLLFFMDYKLSLIKALIYLFCKEVIKIKNSKIPVLNGLLLCVLVMNYRFVYLPEFVYVFLCAYLQYYLNRAVRNFNGKEKKVFSIIVMALLYGAVSIFFSGQYHLLSIVFLLMFTPILQGYFFFSLFNVFILRNAFLMNKVSFLMYQLIQLCDLLPGKIYFEKENLLCLALLILFLIIFGILSEFCLYKKAKYSLLGIVVTMVLFASPIDAYTSSYVIFLNVGQGDAILFHDRNTNVLVDTGGSLYKDIARDVLVPYFKHHHISSLDYVFITHKDYDHFGALETLKTYIPITQIEFGSTFKQKNVGNLHFYNLNQYDVGTEENDESSVLYTYFLSKYFLLMGDASINIEQKIIKDYPDLKVDILKAGHHGSSTSTSKEFIEAYHPLECVISVGVNNRYNHPSKSVIQLLNQYGVVIRRTDIEGSIIYS